MFTRLKNWFLYGVFISDELAEDMGYKRKIVIKKPNPADLDKFLDKEENKTISNEEAVENAKKNATFHNGAGVNDEPDFELSKEERKAIYIAAFQTFFPVLIGFIIVIFIVIKIFF